MPIVTIKSFRAVDKTLSEQIIFAIREAGAKALECTPDNIWVILQTLEANSKIQNLPTIVNIEANEGRSIGQRTHFAEAVSAGVSKGLNIPQENIWIRYQEMRPEDIWFKSHWTKTSS